MNYLLDSNTFIEAKNRYYNMTVCPAYWHWILQKFGTQHIASIALVGKELRDGNDELATWARDNPDLFIGIDDIETQEMLYESRQLCHGKAGLNESRCG